MVRFWPLASWSLLAAGVAEVAVGATNRLNVVSVLVGLLAMLAAAVALREGRFRWPAWVMAALGSALAFRAFIYDAPLAARVLVVASSALFLAALGLGLRARKAEGAPAQPPIVV